MAKTLASRLKFIAIIATFVIPFAIASYVYQNPDVYTPGSSNRGELLENPQSIIKTSATNPDGAALPEDFFTRRWFFVLWDEAPCDLYCEANLFKMQQARLILGRERARVQNIYLTPVSNGLNAHAKQLISKYPHLKTALLQAPMQTEQAAPETASNIFAKLKGGQIYIIDPLGNIIMRYAKDVNTQDMVKDMKWLVKASKIG